MTDSSTDDAPLATSKDSDHTAEVARAAGGSSGDSVTARAVTINRPAAELYAYWRDFGNLATFMDNVVEISAIDRTRSHWVVKAPGGRMVEWDAIVTEEQDGRLIAWKADDGADVPNAGRVEFRDAGDRGTVVTATIAYDPPAGIIGKVIAKMFQREPAIQARRDLRRFKQLMETGEIATGARNRAEHEERDA
ncbi:MAG: SRPBCC family protein [Sphingomonadales bacterium]|nr:SRPBCC family protein [Sphingomonadales bacterium]